MTAQSPTAVQNATAGYMVEVKYQPSSAQYWLAACPTEQAAIDAVKKATQAIVNATYTAKPTTTTVLAAEKVKPGTVQQYNAGPGNLTASVLAS